MKFFHTADWHLGKLVQGIYMTDDQRYVLQQFLQTIETEKPDAVIIAGDLYDRAVPPTEAVNLLDEILETIVLTLKTPVLAISGNHDSPSRLQFGSRMMTANRCHIIGQLSNPIEPVVLRDEHGEVHFHLVPYADPSVVRHLFMDEDIHTHNDAMKTITEHITATMDQKARHVFVGHAFVTPHGEEQENTSDSERPLAIGGAEHVDANLFSSFTYTALGHLHQAHNVGNPTIQYSGSLLKYSISEEHHKKGFYIVNIDKDGHVELEKRLFEPLHDMRTVEATIEDLVKHEKNEDYVFVKLLDETPVLSPMEKVRSIYPNAMHVERQLHIPKVTDQQSGEQIARHEMNHISLFKAFYKEMKNKDASEETEAVFIDVLQELLQEDQEQVLQARKEIASTK